MSKSTFYKVKSDGDWAYIDNINGEPFKDGEFIEVLWGDKSITKHKVSVSKFYEPVMEQGGGSWNVPHEEASIDIEYMGSKLNIRLFDINKIKVRKANP